VENKKREINTRRLNKEAWAWKKQGQKTEGGTDHIKEVTTADCEEDKKHLNSVVKMLSF
jgi:hypothetical protein